MKKSLIAASVASLAVAAMPVVGVFAATPAGTVTDTLNVTIPPSCTIVNQNTPANSSTGNASALTNSYSVEMHNNQLRSDIGGDGDATTGTDPDNVINVSCNTPSGSTAAEAGWKLTAVGAGVDEHVNELYGTSGSIATGTSTNGANSQWAFKVVKTDAVSGVEYASGYDGDFAAVPAGTNEDPEKDLVTGSGNATSAFTMTYQVYISQTQAQGTYTGAVKYTLYNPAD
jgi:hypothetical protein